MTHHTHTTLRSALATVAVSALMLGAAPAFAESHPPLKRADGPQTIMKSLIGEPKGSDIAVAIEERVMAGAITDRLDGKVSKGAIDAARQAYAQNVFAPLWTREAAERLMAANPACRDEGVDSGITDAQLRAAIDARFTGSADARAKADLRLSATWLRLASTVSGGLSDEGGMVRSPEAAPARSDLVAALVRAASGDPVAEFKQFASVAPQYHDLQRALKTYRKHAENGGWMRVRKGKEMLEPGMNDPRVPALRERLRSEGYAAPRRYASLSPDNAADMTAAPTLYDDALVEQLKAWQKAHGLKQDGVLGPATLAALNESVESKISRVQRAMDHWRGFDPGEQYIWVNIPSYRAEGWKDGVREISMDTIVGTKRTPTTNFSDEIEYIVVNPKWFLPIGLFKRQKLRKLRADPGYAHAKKYKIFDRASGAELDPYAVDWNSEGVARRIQMVQSPGPHNALGQLKIIFPNKHSIYLHDTPDRHLFERDVRALSSGCVRLQDPVAMANWLTDHDDAISTAVFNETLESRQRERFHLDRHVQVHLTYLPAAVAPDGRVEFPADIYAKFKKPTLAKGVYPDDMRADDTPSDRFVNNDTDELGPRRDMLQ